VCVCPGLSSLVDRPKVISPFQNVFTFNWTELSVKDQSQKNFDDQQFECKGSTDDQKCSADLVTSPTILNAFTFTGNLLLRLRVEPICQNESGS